jgi:hypothetical protein
MSAAKRKGTAAETAVVEHLRAFWPHVERRALAGSRDRGDVAGIPGVVIEVKAAARLEIPGWLRELEVEIANDQPATGLLVVKPRGVGDRRVGDWWAITRLDRAIHLLKEGGY